MGALSSRSYMALRGSNQSRSLWRASPRRNLRASGVKWVGILIEYMPDGAVEGERSNADLPDGCRLVGLVSLPLMKGEAVHE